MFCLRWSLKQCIKLLDIDALHQVFVIADDMAGGQRGERVGKRQGGHGQEAFHAGHQGGQHGLQVQAEQAEGLQAGGAHVLQAGIHAFFLGQFPGLVLVHIGVHLVGQQHGFPQGAGVVPGVVAGGNGFAFSGQCGHQGLTIG